MKLKFISKVHQSLLQFISENMIMSWGSAYKCILVQILGCLDVALWILWWGVSNHAPSLQKWIDQDIYRIIMPVFSVTIFGFLGLIFITWQMRLNQTFNKYISYITVMYFGSVFIFAGYIIGILSPVSVASYVSLSTVGLVLFERKVLYTTIIPIALIILTVAVLSLNGYLVYAPIYTDLLKSVPEHQNAFWVYGAMFLYIPIFFASLVLFEVLLYQWRNREKMIENISVIDPLTNVFNRRKIGEKLSEFKRHQQLYSIILLDLDYFKTVNDHYGHEVGDFVLKKVAQILIASVRVDDVIGRFGGEEFIILLKDTTSDQALSIAEHCRAEIAKENFWINRTKYIRITASFGVTSAVEFISTKEEIIKQADQALYYAKHQGRNQVRYYLELEKNIKKVNDFVI